jgi:hypothetical protein
LVSHLPSAPQAHKTAIWAIFVKEKVMDGPGDVVPILPFDEQSCDEAKDQSCLLEN